ncbi:MAG: VOC family protein [Dermatophilaceae bacterium]
MTTRTVTTDHPVPVSLSHVVLRTAHLDDTIEFYGRLVGMTPNYRSEGGAALSYDGEHHRMALMQVAPEETNGMAPGLEHLAFKLRSVGELLGNYKRMKDLGVDPLMTIHHGGTLSAYYVDPDGVQVETFVDTRISEISVDQMPTELAANPIGVPVDFDDLLRRYLDGEPVADLLVRPELQEGQLEELVQKAMSTKIKAPVDA